MGGMIHHPALAVVSALLIWIAFVAAFLRLDFADVLVAPVVLWTLFYISFFYVKTREGGIGTVGSDKEKAVRVEV